MVAVRQILGLLGRHDEQRAHGSAIARRNWDRNVTNSMTEIATI